MGDDEGGIRDCSETRSYASAVIRTSQPYDAAEDLERDAAARIERQNILTRDDPPRAVGGPRRRSAQAGSGGQVRTA